MKKTFKLFCLLLVLLTCTFGCESNKKISSEYLKEIDYTSFKEKLDNKEGFILEIVQDGCSNCSDFSPKFINVLEEYKIVAFSLNISNMTEVEKDEFLDEYDVDGTPTVLFFESGKETSALKRIVGTKEEKAIISKLIANGYIEN